ncbi:MAG: glycosyltransferase family 2 protein, partial [Betaproteobacteria bacterium]
MRHWRTGFRDDVLPLENLDEQPLRSELLSADQMEQYGKTLAAAHRLAQGRGRDQLLARLAANEEILISVSNLLTSAVTANRRITPAGEWLLDNFYLIEEQIFTAKRHFPKRYSRELPRLARGPSTGFPRVYDLALQTISHGDGRVDPESLSRFISAYQTITALKLGELWAIPIMLRLALIENLRRVAVRVAAGIIDRNLADSWADQMTEIADKDPKSLILVIADMARSSPPMTTAFVSEFARRLQGQSAALALPLTWIEQLLSESDQTIEQLVQSETQRQASAQVSISNSIASLRFLGAMDWREFVETMSLVEQTLRKDPGGIYGRMDFATRDAYRHVIEKTAKKCHLSEGDVATRAIGLAHEAAAGKDGRDDGNHARAAHVGFYLVDKGLPLLAGAAEATAAHETTNPLPAKPARHLPLLPYLGTIALFTLLLSVVLLAQAHANGVREWEMLLIGFLAVLAASQLGVALTNWLATLLVAPRLLPRMDFSHGIPSESRTLVVVPTMLTSAAGIEALVEALEVRFLANRDESLHFGLLTDFADAQQENLTADGPLLRLTEERITALNDKYRNTQNDSFFLFHRPRRWNPAEHVWMGYERKRGKLAELNSLLRGGGDDRFSLVVGGTGILTNVRYVITLDTDTQLPRDTARQFVASMAHPLNRAVYDVAAQRVVEGYGILQPRVAVSLPGANRSWYARLFGSEPGIDPYTRAVSDVYQDVFGEGSFIGKCIYDVDAFERTLKGRFPENRILSHDLLEGCCARSALISDVQLYEEYPASYQADVSRRHRWMRGDWQIASWLLPRVPAGDAGAGRRQNTLSVLSQWKIFDNLRRSLIPAALTILLLLGWTVLSPAWAWTLVVMGIILIPSLTASIYELFRKPDDVLLRQHLAAAARATGEQFAQSAFTLACLPYEAHFSLDAIIRTNWRILVSKKRLLEWTTSASAEVDNRTGLLASYRSMWMAPALAAITTAYLTAAAPAALAVAGPILILWLVSPAIAWWISRPLIRREPRLAADQITFLRKHARRTWAFFETFVGADDNWLPPDNFQEHPVGKVAHRTSPTNMGLALLANLTAHDFGYIPAGNCLERTAQALATMAGLTQYRGHFYNWYDTQSLLPLAPLYVSSVDSGNLAGHLLTLRPGLLALADDRILA